MKLGRTIIFLLTAAMTAVSCSTTRVLQEGEYRLARNKIEVSGEKIEAVYMIPGWTHNIINLSETENLVTVMTCNEIFDPNCPDTFGEPV